jgi:hypothetical protein
MWATLTSLRRRLARGGGVGREGGQREGGCPLSTGGGTRRVQSVRQGGGGGGWLQADEGGLRSKTTQPPLHALLIYKR